LQRHSRCLITGNPAFPQPFKQLAPFGCDFTNRINDPVETGARARFPRDSGNDFGQCGNSSALFRFFDLMM
jgi:hypothetical protein